MRHFNTYLIFLILLDFSRMAEQMKVKFKKLECEEFDRPFASFKKCYLKALARDTVALHVHVQLHQVPVTNITVNAALFQRGSGYRPFMYNNTGDFCRFLEGRNRSMFWKIIFEMVQRKLNINHACPVDHDVIVDGLILRGDMFKLIPFPSNDYMFQLQFAAYNKYRARVKAYISIYD